MKVRHDPPAHPGDNGKQGGERFRAIQKYPPATDMATKRSRDNDTLYGAGGEPGRGEIPMDPIRYRASDDFLFCILGSRKNEMQRRKPQTMF